MSFSKYQTFSNKGALAMSNSYLIVVDMQNDFIDGALGTPEAQAIVEAVAQRASSFDGTVVLNK